MSLAALLPPNMVPPHSNQPGNTGSGPAKSVPGNNPCRAAAQCQQRLLINGLFACLPRPWGAFATSLQPGTANGDRSVMGIKFRRDTRRLRLCVGSMSRFVVCLSPKRILSWARRKLNEASRSSPAFGTVSQPASWHPLFAHWPALSTPFEDRAQYAVLWFFPLLHWAVG